MSRSDLEIGNNLDSSRLRRSTRERNVLDMMLNPVAADNIGCTSAASCIDGQSIESPAADNNVDEELQTNLRLPLFDSSRVSLSGHRKRYASIFPDQELDGDCADACAILEVRRPEMVTNAGDCVERFCQRAFPQRDDTAKMTVKRWGSRVCMETHCRSHQKDAHSYIACGMAYCGWIDA